MFKSAFSYLPDFWIFCTVTIKSWDRDIEQIKQFGFEPFASIRLKAMRNVIVGAACFRRCRLEIGPGPGGFPNVGLLNTGTLGKRNTYVTWHAVLYISYMSLYSCVTHGDTRTTPFKWHAETTYHKQSLASSVLDATPVTITIYESSWHADTFQKKFTIKKPSTGTF